MKEYCGIFGIYGNLNAAYYTYLGLYALQHRGQESAGIAVRMVAKSLTTETLGLFLLCLKVKALKN